MKKTILLLAFICLITKAFSQEPESSDVLSDRDFEQMTTEIKKKVRIFQGYVTDLAGNSFTREEKESKYQDALTLFIGQGDPFEVLVPTRNGEVTQMHEAVKMGVYLSKYNKKRVYSPMKEYLSKLISSNKYKRVVIEFSDVIIIDNYRSVGDGRFVALAHYLQKYTAYKTDGGAVSYWDYTAKTITIYINRLEIDLPEGGTGHYWQVLLGDVDCDDVS